VIEYRALGPLSAWSDGVSVALGGPKQRMVLAVLLVHANRVVSVDRLVDGVWGEHPPRAARHTLHGYVSELRKILDGQPQREGGGYKLGVESDRFDVLRFERLCAEGRTVLGDDPAAASEVLSAALTLWDGTPYADLAEGVVLDGEIRRLGELRLEAVENRIEADLQMGLDRRVIGELEALAREHPFRERLWAQLMLALYRSGRQAEALRVFGRVRRLLAEELGVDPSPELEMLRRRILEQDSVLSSSPPATVERDPSLRIVRGYELRQVVGEGISGVVYEGYQPSIGRPVAVKVIRREYAGMAALVQRFEAEEQFIAQLEHPHIVPLHDYWRDPSGGYLVMPLMRGGSLAAALRRGPWNPLAAMNLLDQIGSALGHAHRQGIVHRDVKPSNILLDAEGNAYLSDFGLSVRLADATGAPLTSSAEYLAPETSRGEPPSRAADIFGLAVLTFELLTGVRPAGTATVGSIADVRPHLPDELGAVLAKATNDVPSGRYQRVEDFLGDVRRALGEAVAGTAPDAGAVGSAPARNPFKGLRAFQETDAVDFYGRDALVDELVRAVATHRLVGVVGASGCGKSSVIRAGLIPALRAGSVPTSRSWLITDMFPGSYPFEELETALLRVAQHDPGSLILELSTDERGLLRVIKRILPTDDSELVLVVDQLEELFAMGTDADVRRRFLDAVTTVVTDQRSRIRVVVSLRADFFDRPLDYPAFGALLGAGLVTVTAPDEEALRQAIVGPATGVGLELEPGLAEKMVDDVLDEPGGLPLLQFALTELFRRRDGDKLTIAAYESSGRVAAALGRRASELYDGLSAAGREAARHLFLRLVNVEEDSDDTRRRVRRGELEALDVDRAVLDDVIAQFADARLLTLDRDPVSRGPTVEVAHEALIREWPTLRGWVDEHRHSLVLHRRFTAAMREWEDNGRGDAFLMSGGRLDQLTAWAAETELLLTTDERDFLARSRRATSRRRRRRSILRWTAIAVVMVLAIVAFAQRRSAQREARHATVRELAGASNLALAEDPERSLLLGLRAVDMSRDAGEDPLPEAVGALNSAVQASRLEMRLPDGAGNVAVSPDGTMLATDSYDPDFLWGRQVVIWDAISGGLLRTLESSGLGSVSAGSAMPGAEGGRSLAFSPDGELLAVTYGAGEAPVVLWDPRTGAEVVRLEPPGSAAWNPTWSPDGTQLAVASSDGTTSTVTTWDPDSGRTLMTLEPDSVGEISLYDDDTLVISHGPEQRIGFYDLATGEQVDSLATPGLDGLYIAVDRVHRRIAVSMMHDELQVWDIESRARLWTRPLSASRRLTIDPRGEFLAMTGAEGMVRLLDLDDGSETMALAGHNAAVGDVAFTPADDRLISVSNDGETRIWSIAPTGSPSLGSIHIDSGRPFLVDFSPDGAQVGASTWEGSYERHDATTGELLGLIDGLMADQVVNPVVSPDWRLLAGVTAAGQAMLWDLESGDPIRTLPPCSNPRAFSPDGSALVVDTGWLCPQHAAPDGSYQPNRVIDVESGETILDLPSSASGADADSPTPIIFRAAFNPGGALEAGRFLAVNVDTAALEIYELDSGAVVARYENLPNLIRFDPSGRYLAAGTGTNVFVVDLVALADGADPDDAVTLNQFSAPGGVPGVAITTAGVVASIAFDSPFIRLWDLRSGDLVVELRTTLDGSSPPHLNFSPDGTYLLYPDAGQVLRRFPLDTARLVELAETRVTRDLTVDECRRYLDTDVCT
jgi:DNA-binding SARP family transcriptional activator/WD40 repeat protein